LSPHIRRRQFLRLVCLPFHHSGPFWWDVMELNHRRDRMQSYSLLLNRSANVPQFELSKIWRKVLNSNQRWCDPRQVSNLLL
jgi:hypothetical protein